MGKIGDILVERGLLTKEELDKALMEQKLSGKRLGDILIDQGYSKEEDVVAALSEQMGLAFIDLFSYEIEQEVLESIDAEIAHKYQVIPLFKIERALTVAMADPLNIQIVDELNHKTNLELQPVFATKSGIKAALDKYYSKGSDLEKAISEIKEESSPTENESKITQVDTEISANEAPAIKLVNLILAQSIRDGASDIHFEPGEKEFKIRCRIDGVLHCLKPPPHSLTSAIISRLKVLANLDIAEKRLPQDGRVQIEIEGKKIDLRMSSFPTIHGENIVIRILDKSKGILSLPKLGLSDSTLEKVEVLIEKPNGIILVTGPTGSGKTTSLYSFLNAINRENRNIMTMEDPVEYHLPLIRQANVDVKAGLTFQSGLRSIMRQDPDIIMIGEIRDKDTAEISIQAALTGHLVLSTLHTNDAPSTIARLIDMGVEPFLIASSIAGVMAQRLLRRLCFQCRESYQVSDQLSKTYHIPAESELFKENGCSHCRETGFLGRLGIYELLIPDDAIRNLITEKASSVEIEAQALKSGFEPLQIDGINKARQGLTSLSEVLKATH